MSKTHSTHRVNGSLVKVKRRFDPVHLDAGYHEQEWGEHSSPDHELLGDHDGITVEHVDGDDACTHGPEFRLTWPAGHSVNVLCADVAREYLGLADHA